MLARAGAPVVGAQRILPHSDPRLTANLNSRVDLGDLREGLNRIGIPAMPKLLAANPDFAFIIAYHRKSDTTTNRPMWTGGYISGLDATGQGGTRTNRACRLPLIRPTQSVAADPPLQNLQSRPEVGVFAS